MRAGRLLAAVLLTMAMPAQAVADAGQPALNALFAGWRQFEAAIPASGVPDYTPPAVGTKAAALKTWQARLAALDRSGWSTADKVDWNLVRAEMNGLDFDLRVLKPWQRDPAFYVSIWDSQSDTPAHEGPIHHAPIELWQYSFPLNIADAARLTAQLRTIPPLLVQARGNLTGNTRDLWTSAVITVDAQSEALANLAKRTAGAGPVLARAIADARTATDAYIAWLKVEAPRKTGPSGVGIDNYNWYLKNVQLSPLDWTGEVAILRRELARSHAALRLEEHNHRKLPPLTSPANAAEYDAKAKGGARQYIAFMRDNDILTVRDYMEPALLARTGAFAAAADQDFFTIVQHRAPMALWTHFYHWFDLAHMRTEPRPRPIRRGPLLYNIWVSRAEGFATANEEMMLNAGLFDTEPRQREVVWIMQAQRAARGLAALLTQANMIDLPAAQAMQVARTPNGWMSPRLPLLAFEQGLYLRQPGYGASYITGKYQTDALFTESFEKFGAGWSVKHFYDGLNDYGMIPVSMIRWEWLGQGDEAKAIGSD